MERIVLVHGSVTGGRLTWGATARALEGRFELLVVERPGFPPAPPVPRVDFEHDAAWLAGLLRAGDHLVGHSYGGVVTLLASARVPGLVASSTVIEPPCTAVALDDPAVAAFAAGGDALYARGRDDDPEVFVRAFLAAVGSDWEPPSPLPPELEQGARLLAAERGPWEADIPLAALADAAIPTLVVSGAHHAAFDGICDVLERTLSAERVDLPGYGHAAQRHPDFPEVLADFVERAATASP
ncbi:MAG TPA: alpha/beta hydrolase [Candidatus Limnocylindria bacterium]